MITKSIYLFAALVLITLNSCHSKIENFTEVSRLPAIFPDYTGILIPPNMAPLNFTVQEPGTEYEVRIHTGEDNQMVVRSKSPSIKMGIDSWHKLLKKGMGEKLLIDVFVRQNDGNWQKFQPITNEISKEGIDNHLAYRLINTAYGVWNNLGIYQRNLENFDQKPILENKSFEYGCLNCHSFRHNDPNSMMIHIRAIHGGTIIIQDGKLRKIDTKNKYTLSAGTYPCWHPDGKHIAYSVNKINWHFGTGETRMEVSDEFSDIVVYDIEKNTLTTSPKVSTASRENLPNWSPDGKFLYFISAPVVTNLDDRIQGKYDLLRIAYDVNSNVWGSVDTIISSKKIGKSISFPKISPNGKFLMFCTSDNGYFTIHHPQTDLNLLNLETGEYHKMEINSPQTDSYHCFSNAGHWFVFSSKRIDGLFTRPFFSYLDDSGKATKPFVLPQEDPEFYNTFLKNYNIPELITGEVTVSPQAIRDKVLETAIAAKLDPSVDTLYMKSHLQTPKK
ncbi:MAG: cytochrome C biosynthesis protein [Bacteroidia bacterium]